MNFTLVFRRIVSEEQGVKAQGVTKALGPTFSPYWDESMVMQYPADDNLGLNLFILS